MRKKTLILIFFSALLPHLIWSQSDTIKKSSFKRIFNNQKIHLGVRPYFSYINLVFESNSGFAFYFANEQNESIKANNEFWTPDPLKTIKPYPYPDIYTRYNLGNNFFCQLDLFAFWFQSTYKYLNSVDIGEYTESFNPNGQWDELNYNSLKINWFFMGNSLVGGYSFLKTKAVQPFLFGGVSSFYRIGFNPSSEIWSADNNRRYRNLIILSKLDTFRPVTFYLTFGGGIKYRGVSLELYYQHSQLVLDRWHEVFYQDEYSIDDEDFFPFNYNYLGILNFSVSVNIFSKNLAKDKIHEAKK